MTGRVAYLCEALARVERKVSGGEDVPPPPRSRTPPPLSREGRLSLSREVTRVVKVVGEAHHPH
jgi:hypothetical protein